MFLVGYSQKKFRLWFTRILGMDISLVAKMKLSWTLQYRDKNDSLLISKIIMSLMMRTAKK